MAARGTMDGDSGMDLASPTDRVQENVAMDGNLMGCGDAHELKDPLNTTDARNMLGGCGDPPAVEWINADTRVVINPLLLVSACFGSWKALNFLLDREDAQKPPMVMQTQEFFHLLTSDGTTNTQAFENDVEEGVDQLAFPAADAPLLNGVTVEGDTALHAVASHGDDTNYLKCANIIHDRAKHLLFVLNGNGDTPLHCAARAGKSKMVLRLISQVTNEDARHELLRKENGRKETALHEAVRIGDNRIVDLLMTADLQLANYPSESISPLYLAILLEKYTIAMTLYETSKGNLSYSGPNGQNALHAAVHRSKGMTEKLLVWNKSLTTQADTNGSTPLHFASDQLGQSKISVQQQVLTISLFPWFRRIYSSQIVDHIFKANLAPLYQPDKCGLYPIHIAASIGAESTIAAFTERCPSSASLRDARGRTFLHVAVEKKMNNVVLFACQNSSLEWILNLQDNEGNTALHLAVQAKSLGLFCSLFGNPRTLLNLTNNNGQTPFDVTRNGSTSSYLFDGDIGIMLRSVGAKRGVCRSDHYKEKYGIDPKNKLKQSESLKNSAESQGIVTVLIATMTFGATFALPGGYRADDHTNGGTPTLAGRYVFSAFLMANTLAFVCSSIATLGIMYAGNTRNKMSFRRAHFLASSFFAHGSVTSLSVAFALGVYSVLAPVAPKTANAICIISSLVVLYNEAGGLRRLVLLTNSLCKRVGFITAMRDIIPAAIGGILRGFWQFIVIFIWLAYVSKSQQH
ncbi:hypothetical protein QYE76_020055 [Lolium multiflorum]|uniref:PGG domain-containing protein n=1 Tax=Lolium multiflorum TaxID=4521 RepID=A0AAD8VRS7_LOLMU|nr:hypothetical protein QYE76_020055 [Lolium multiflorum]